MKKLLIGIAVQLGVLNMTFGQQINALEIHEGNTKSIHALSHIDSIMHTTDSLTIHKGNQADTYSQSTVDSAKYTALAIDSIPCNFDGYTGQYSTMTDSRDGNVYKTVTIGNQTWMAENLRYDVPGVYSVGATSVDTINPNNPCKSYGRLYDWTTMMNGDPSSTANPSTAQGICPNGWHIPSDAEWKELELALNMTSTAVNNSGWRGTYQGTALKSKVGWTSNGNGTNNYGFNVFSAGNYSTNSFDYRGVYGFFWSSKETTASTATSRYLSNTNTKVHRRDHSKSNGFSCRCVEN